MDWAVIVGSGITLIGTLATIAITFRAARQANRVTEESNDKDAALRWVAQFREEAQQARVETSQAREEAQRAVREATRAWQYAHRMAEEVRVMRQVAWDESMTMSRYREFLATRAPATMEEGL